MDHGVSPSRLGLREAAPSPSEVQAQTAGAIAIAADQTKGRHIVFAYFAIPAKYQHRVLFWGIIGALLMRGGMIFIGGELILRFQWILISFGLLLVATAVKMAFIKSESDPGKNPIVRLVKKLYPVTDFFDGQKFFTVVNECPALLAGFFRMPLLGVDYLAQPST